ncbi:zinc finger BED domain-containing protein RICESLEEPER 2-like [Prosopis cineraria]|uniref:zinc finger BED domain-containing protein RICESLEEPER 2-like n=1 Tax=Prosopis cineraria TaxID=364024 RepID=UPI0024102AC7|nr:zinc finger BED domain-containing protein RICESLEEPER 2-like [Prosopis cineraria]
MVDETFASASIDQPLPTQLIGSSQNKMPPPTGSTPSTPPLVAIDLASNLVQDCGSENVSRKRKELEKKSKQSQVWEHFVKLPLEETNGEILKQVLKKSVNRVCLTTDCWTSTQNFNYLCLTCHSIDPEWKLHKRILNFCMIENHRGDTIGKTIEKCLLEWGIEKVFTITMDNASSNDTALSYLKRRLRNCKGMVCGGDYLQLRSCAHILNLVVNDGLKELKNSFDAIHNAIKYVHSSPARLQKFKSVAELEKLNTTSLVYLDVNTRWNSTYLMLESALKIQKAFECLEDEDEDYMGQFIRGTKREGPPKASDWNKTRVFLNFLKLLEENIVNVDPLLMKMSLSMRSKYEKYWGQTENMNPLLIVAVILDPRYKLAYVNHIFEQLFLDLEVCMAMKIKIKYVLYHMFDEYSKGLGISIPSNASSSTLPGSSTCSMLKGQGGIDPGPWWRANSSKYKVLSMMARDVLAIPVSTVASESTLSTGGRVVDSYRSSLSPKMTEVLICAQNWLLPGQSISKFASMLQEFNNFQETEGVVKTVLLMSEKMVV